MYVHPVTRTKKLMINKMAVSMSLYDIKQERRNHAKNRRIIREQRNKYKNKNKLNVQEMM